MITLSRLSPLSPCRRPGVCRLRLRAATATAYNPCQAAATLHTVTNTLTIQIPPDLADDPDLIRYTEHLARRRAGPDGRRHLHWIWLTYPPADTTALLNELGIRRRRRHA